MKCRYCNGEVGLEQKYCPYCGRPNEQAVQHYSDMASFRGRYADTEAEVIRHSERYARIIPRTVIIVLLLVLAAAMYIVSENAYGFPQLMRSRAAEKRPEATMSVLEGYLEEGDYISFSSYISYNGIKTYNSAFERYRHVYWCSEYYQDIVMHMEKLFLHTDREGWIKYSASDDIRMLCQSLEYFYDAYNRGADEPETADYVPYLEDMKGRVADLLNVYLGIDDSELDGFLAMSDNRKAAYIEEVLLDAKSEG